MIRLHVAPLLLGAVLLAASAAPTEAQQPGPGIRAPVADTGIFSPLDLPAGNEFRTASGLPGPRYWQQRADYTIRATLDTAAKRIAGSERIRYTNNSPDTLRFVWMQLDQNLFRPGSTGSLLFPPDTRFSARNFPGGFDLARVAQVSSGTTKPVRRAGARPADSAGTELSTRVDGTMMYVALAAPLPPKGITTFAIDYAFNVPEHGADRMGRDGSLYEIAQWYPRMAVYDDVHGWNTLPYLGQGEFYLEYGDFDYFVTLPAGYIMAGTGTLQNAAQVLTPAERRRLTVAAGSDTTVHIVTEDEIRSGAARPTRSGTQTWHFHAGSVRDVAWAACPEYLWDASGWDGIVTQAYYRPSARATWFEAARMTRFSIREYSTRWFHYPYPQMTSVEGPVTGMEYPMLAMDEAGDTREELYSVATHEIGHMWYPMVVGSDERRYAWMDEGFNTFINTFSEEDYFQRNDAERRRAETLRVLELDQGATPQPIMTAANRYLNNDNLGSLAYVKPSIVLLALRNEVLGPATFDAAFREYTRRWAFKHPQPADFFNTMENVSGENLAWFWRSWFYTTDALDQAVTNVVQRADTAGGTVARITLSNNGAAVMPVDLQLTLADSSTELVKLPVEIWFEGDTYLATVEAPKPIVAARVNADGRMPDVAPANDEWHAPMVAGPTPAPPAR